MASIGDLFLRMLADDTGFTAEVTKKAETAGTAAGSSMGSKLSAGLKVGLAAAGTAAGALFAIGAKGAGDLQNAMARFRAETGATDSEVQSAQKSILGLWGRNVQSIDEIARAQAALRTEWGLTQKQAEAATQSVLDFANATGQDAADAVKQLDDILDSYRLDASKATGVMDLLIASHQKFGGTVDSNAAALAALAPAFTGLGMTVEDANSWIDLFNASGVDAESTAMSFSKALKNVKSPEEFKRLVADISATQDPLLRAQKATDLFGKSGTKMGLALAGVDPDLSAYRVGMDQAAGATTKASDAIKNTPLNQLQMALRAVVTPAIEAGQAFGPLILALGQLGGGKLLAGVASGLGGLAGVIAGKLGIGFAKAAESSAITKGAETIADMSVGAIEKRLAGTAAADALGGAIGDSLEAGGGSSRISAAADKIGNLLGGRIGKLAGAGLIAGIAAAFAVEEFNARQSQVQGIGDKLAEGVGAAFADKSLEEIKAAREKLAQEIASNPIFGSPLDIFGAGAEAKKQLDALDALIASKTAEIPPNVARNLADGAPDVAAGADTMVSGITPAMAQAAAETAALAGKTPGEIADGLRSERGAIDSAMEQLVSDEKTALGKGAEYAKLVGQLTSKELAAGLHSTDPVVRGQAEHTQQLIRERLGELGPISKKEGAKAIAELAAGLKSKDPKIREQAEKTKAIIEQKLKENRAKQIGETTGGLFGEGIANKEELVRTDADKLVTAVENPLHGIGSDAYTYGLDGGKNYAQGWLAALYTLKRVMGQYANVVATHLPKQTGHVSYRAAGGPVAANQGYIVGEAGPEYFVPQSSGTIIPAAMQQATTMAGGAASLVIQGGLHLHDIGSDVSPARAKRFGLAVMDEVAAGFQQQGARIGLRPVVRP